MTARNPRTGEDDYSFSPVSAEDLAVRAAKQRNAQRDWRELSLEERSSRMRGLAGAIRNHQSEIAAALETDTGRRRIARMEVMGAAASIDGWIIQAPSLLPSGWTEGRSRTDLRHAPQFIPFGLVGSYIAVELSTYSIDDRHNPRPCSQAVQ